MIRSNGQVTQLNLSSMFQMSVVAASVMSVAAIALTSLAAKSELAIDLQVDAGSSQAELARAVEALKTQLADAKSAADQADSRVKTLADQRKDTAPSADGDAQQAAAELDAAKLTERVAQLESDIKILGVQNAQNRSLYEHTAEQLAQATSDRQKLTAEKGKLQKSMGELAQAKDAAEKTISADRERLKLKLGELEKKLATRVMPQQQAEVTGKLITVPAEGDAEPTGKIVPVDNGFSIEKLLAQLGVHQAAVGGPYVAVGANKGAQLPDEQVAKLMKTLPLTAPLDKYNFESPFGVRHDPFNGRAAMHTGVDLSGPYKTPVMSTAPGTIVFAGYSTGYGKLVEIDHGNGIHTKYGHLNRILVNVGQKIGKHSPIGLLGSSGRSTGPHVHYEVVVNGTPQDPEKFLEAGKSGILKASY
ncbi:MAG TPA: peptidoglycan DD-metalloendopeptidase family protein [Aliidongia sp.]|uniref:peptidoglycan DD-metalloendopeptidase family protein n=1 Tax=Aliidongia sp. TaxID=1914230 RepID=UPI002DDD814E|nr:peptidoglycan DD-metalloendopeptidase family protein [Aliidongia sp.]HEV2674615.1 peptidoglycan DD-metalloendopeptidase family protein [Aliidongia sp.]